jgi:aminoglycoside phosphotransferase (APT) family kinase protein
MPEQIQELQQAVRRIAARYPGAGARCERLSRQLQDTAPRLPEVPLVPVHGSFKSGHILHDNDHVTIIDFDGAGLGDPMYDVGRYIARLEILGLASPAAKRATQQAIANFRRTYAAGVPWGWPDLRARWYTSAHLVSSQAHKSVKRMAPELVEATLDCAERWLPAELLT